MVWTSYSPLLSLTTRSTTPPGYTASAAVVARFAVVPLTIVPEPSRWFAGIWPSCFDVVGAPRVKGIALDGENVADPPLAGCTTTCVAVMAVPLVVPRTRTDSPALTALAVVALAPLRYVVEDALWTVTF